MREHGKSELISAKSRVQASDGEALRYLALNGVGMARLAAFCVRSDMAVERLVEVLPERMVAETEAFHAVCVGQGGPLPARVRVMLTIWRNTAAWSKKLQQTARKRDGGLMLSMIQVSDSDSDELGPG